MEQRETLDGRIAALDASIAALETTAQELRDAIGAAEAEIDAEVASETAARDAQASAIAAPLLVADYERRRAQNKGAGAARLGRHDLPGVPPHDPVDRSRADPPGRRAARSRTATTAARSSFRDPGVVVRRERDRTRLDEIVIYCDGGSRGNPGPAAIGAVVLDPASDPPRRLATVSECIGETTSNVAEYRALIAGLRGRRAVRRAASCACAPTRSSSSSS